MAIKELRERLEEVRAYVAKGDTEEALREIDATICYLGEPKLLTLEEAADFLNVRSLYTLRSLLHLEGVAVVKRDGAVLIPLRELERIYNSERVRGIRASDAVHDELDRAFGTGEMTQEEMDILEASRPGTNPWER